LRLEEIGKLGACRDVDDPDGTVAVDRRKDSGIIVQRSATKESADGRCGVRKSVEGRHQILLSNP
jgi:hypothetical protein